MTFIENLTSLRDSSQSAYHHFLLNFPKNIGDYHMFFEGKEDISFYRNFIDQANLNSYKIARYNCGGKREVYEAREKVLAKSGRVKSMYFVDKDFSDFLNLDYPSGKDVFVTDFYSIENYLITIEVFQRICEELFNIDETAIIEELLEAFHFGLISFHEVMLPVSAWIITAIRDGKQPNYKNINLDNLLGEYTLMSRVLG